MRVLCSITGTTSHGRASLPLVRELVAAGHEVLIVTGEKAGSVFGDERVRVAVAYTDHVQQGLGLLVEGKLPISGTFSKFAPDLWAALACGPQILESYEKLLVLAEDFRPDVIVRDGFEFAAVLVSERIGVPQVPVPSGSGQFLGQDVIGPRLDELRREAGLPVPGDPGAPYRYGRLDCLPARYSFAREPAPDAVAYQQPRVVSADQELPDWLDLSAGDKPLVLASFGASLPSGLPGFLGQAQEISSAIPVFDLTEPLACVATALSTVECSAVVSTMGLPLEPGLAGSNVRIVDRFPQPVLLEHASVFVTHGGYNSVREAMRAGVPMVVLPLFADQRYNALRVEELGLGIRLSSADPAAMAEACRRLLADPPPECAVAKEKMLALPGIETAVRYLESLA